LCWKWNNCWWKIIKVSRWKIIMNINPAWMLAWNVVQLVIIARLPAQKKKTYKWWQNAYSWTWNALSYVLLPRNSWAWIVTGQKTFVLFAPIYAMNVLMNVQNTMLLIAKNVPRLAGIVLISVWKWLLLSLISKKILLYKEIKKPGYLLVYYKKVGLFINELV